MCFSLLAAFVTVLAKQWLLEYSRQGQTGSAVVRGRTRHQKFLGLDKWHTSLIIDSLPNLLNLSLLIFFIGLIDFLWPLSHLIAIVLVFFVAFGVLFFFMTSIIALTYPHSPFRTPTTAVCERAFQYLSQKCPLLSHLQNSAPHLLDAISRNDAQAMVWIMENDVDENAIQSASLSVITLPPRCASEGALQHDVPGAIIRLLMVAATAARYSAEAKLTRNNAVTDVVSVTLRALYHVLRPIVLDSRGWVELKGNRSFQEAVAPHLRALKSLNLNSESSNLLWMIQFCIGNAYESPDQLMTSMMEKLSLLSDATFKLDSLSLETLVQHAALLVIVYGINIKNRESPSYGIYYQLDRILWTYALSSSRPPITVLNSIALTMIHGHEKVDVPTDVSEQILFSEQTFVVPSPDIPAFS